VTLFPFTERIGQKLRPILLVSHLSFNRSHSQAICAMITTASNTRWPSDIEIRDLAKAGLRFPSVVRLKIFTIQTDRLGLVVGHLSGADTVRVDAGLSQVLA